MKNSMWLYLSLGMALLMSLPVLLFVDNVDVAAFLFVESLCVADAISRFMSQWNDQMAYPNYFRSNGIQCDDLPNSLSALFFFFNRTNLLFCTVSQFYSLYLTHSRTHSLPKCFVYFFGGPTKLRMEMKKAWTNSVDANRWANKMRAYFRRCFVLSTWKPWSAFQCDRLCCCRFCYTVCTYMCVFVIFGQICIWP